MSENENHHHGRNEIIIVKRHSGGDHEGHHGGVWKIAYADFMTAMMAFFLVMWLVNAANEETKASVASYFNPIKLSDEKPTQKGLKKPVDRAEGDEKQEKSKEKEEAETIGASAATGDDQTSTSGDETNYSEADYFENPYAVLSEIAQEVGQQANVSAKGEGGASDSGPATGADGGEAYRDPFDPDFWTQQVEVTRTDVGNAAAEDSAAATPETPAEAVPDKSDAEKTEQAVAMMSPGKPEVSQDKPDATLEAKVEVPQKAEAQSPEEPAKDAAETAEAEQAEALKEEIRRAIGNSAGKLVEGLVVTPAEGGLLVTISDQLNDPMFNIGSAVPRKELVVAMEKVGKILADRKGAVAIRGHTDGRQFKGGQNDNWRLSTARAHSAYYMLVRGGLDEQRVSQVSGFADRRLKVPENPLDDSNRRIEILLQADQG
ncbi:MotB family protein [Rhizobiaceae bacterium n13]|uniref:MotB family protein n=1 Tax=Ferirhizobium litorale TaxID=2927786 RepID=A0AAE3QFC9_9HYPH|nr:MotB family protein [Fererhizobium litorale]MDI7863412.1 MotB family protein [Fererhizobium litorale]MDI7922311.1 MotB family protein [Fererhizobium litorale]